MKRVVSVLAALFTAAAGSFSAPSALANADTWPSRPVRLVLPFPPGATADAFARAVAPRLSEAIGQPVVVDNRPGAGGAIGSDQVARAEPDGHTLLMTFSTHYLLPFVQKAVPYDPLKDFVPIVAAASIHTVLAVHPSNPAQNLEQFLDRARASAEGTLYATGGVGSSPHLAGELLAQAAQLKLVHVPYKGGGPMLTDLIGGQVTTGFTVLSTATPHAQAGRLRLLAVMSSARARTAPDLPAITERVPNYAMPDIWIGVLGPAKLSAAHVDKIHRALRSVLEQPALREQLNGVGFEVTASLSPQALQASVQKATEVFRQVTSRAGIEPR